ncbi:MAG: methionyl-tRNA formyltransferase [Chitinophagales bacterium]|nr:MAG: methionyl-tRNA formyltransferase [Chitinophagales bacterium]
MRIVFMGTPEFAVPSLAQLLQAGYDIRAVVTAPDKPAGRGLRVSESAVKKFSLQHQLRVIQPLRLRDEQFLKELTSLQPDLQVVVAFRMLPEPVWSFPPLGTINLHASLLPDYRGAAPINWAIINGEKETGLTTFFIEKEIDTGRIIFQQRMSIGEEETAGELHDRMKIAGAGLVLKTVQAIERGEAPAVPQDPALAIHQAPKLTREMCRIEWTRSANTVFNHIRGLSPYPGAWTLLDGKIFKILRAQKQHVAHAHPPGLFLFQDHELRVAVPDGYILPLEVQLEGKKRLPVGEFLKGYIRQ